MNGGYAGTDDSPTIVGGLEVPKPRRDRQACPAASASREPSNEPASAVPHSDGMQPYSGAGLQTAPASAQPFSWGGLDTAPASAVRQSAVMTPFSAAGLQTAPPSAAPHAATMEPYSSAGLQTARPSAAPYAATTEPYSSAGLQSAPVSVAPYSAAMESYNTPGLRESVVSAAPHSAAMEPYSSPGLQNSPMSVAPSSAVMEPYSSAGLQNSPMSVAPYSAVMEPYSSAGLRTAPASAVPQSAVIEPYNPTGLQSAPVSMARNSAVMEPYNPTGLQTAPASMARHSAAVTPFSAAGLQTAPPSAAPYSAAMEPSSTPGLRTAPVSVAPHSAVMEPYSTAAGLRTAPVSMAPQSAVMEPYNPTGLQTAPVSMARHSAVMEPYNPTGLQTAPPSGLQTVPESDSTVGETTSPSPAEENRPPGPPAFMQHPHSQAAGTTLRDSKVLSRPPGDRFPAPCLTPLADRYSAPPVSVASRDDQGSHLTTYCLATSTPAPKVDLQPPGFFEQGRWEYVCVDSEGLQLLNSRFIGIDNRAGGEVRFGEVVTVYARGREASSGAETTWLCLVDNRGWAYDRSQHLVMSEVSHSEISDEFKDIMTHPSLTGRVGLHPTPVYSISSYSSSVGPGCAVTVLAQASVLAQRPLNKNVDVRLTFLKVESDQDAEGGKVVVTGWMPSSSPGDDTPYVVKREPPVKWASITTAYGLKLYKHPDLKSREGKLDPGELVKIVEVISEPGSSTFYKLSTGKYFCGEERSDSFEFVTREPHIFEYTCDDMAGTAVRRKPTRCKNQNTGKELKGRQKVCTSELVSFPNGDLFLRVAVPDMGWVPVTRLDGSVKMLQGKPYIPQSAPAAFGATPGPGPGPSPRVPTSAPGALGGHFQSPSSGPPASVGLAPAPPASSSSWFGMSPRGFFGGSR